MSVERLVSSPGRAETRSSAAAAREGAGPIHIVIRQERYVGGSRERPEIGVFTQTHSTRPPVPWGQIKAGQTVYMKWAGGPIVGKATVAGFRQIADCTSEKLRSAVAGSILHDVKGYWQNLRLSRPVFFALVVHLDSEEWLRGPITPGARSRGASWVVVPSERASEWLTNTEARPILSRSGQPKPSRTIPAGLRARVLQADNFRCVWCGAGPSDGKTRLHADHVVPWSKGGASIFDNLVAACSECNLGKGAARLSDTQRSSILAAVMTARSKWLADISG